MPVAFQYSPPVDGGSFKVTTEMAVKYPFLVTFTEDKLQTAYIWQCLQPECPIKPIVPNACETEIINLARAYLPYQNGSLPTRTGMLDQFDLPGYNEDDNASMDNGPCAAIFQKLIIHCDSLRAMYGMVPTVPPYHNLDGAWHLHLN